MTASKLHGLFRLIRFELPFSAGVCVVMGQLLALGEFAPAAVALSGFLSVFCISASILALNDYFDVETDRINAPDRPIPSNAVTPNEALALSVALLAIGVILGFLIDPAAVLLILMLAVIGFLYNRRFKKSGLAGNLMVSVSVGMTFIYGGVTVGLPFSKGAWLFGLIAALIDLGEEIAADAMDMEGDRLTGSRSLAIVHGKRFALAISAGLFSTVILLTLLPFVLRWFPLPYLLPMAVMDGAIGYSTVRLARSQGQEGRKYIRWLYLGATAGLLAFIAMRLTGV